MPDASILCAVDLTPAAPRTVDLGIAAAKAFGVKLDLVHVIDDADSWWPEAPELQEAAKAAKEDRTRYETILESELEKEKARCVAAGVECEALVVRGRPWRVIPELAEKRGSFLIAIGPYGSSGPRSVLAKGASERVLGSTAQRVIRAADRPVFVATGDAPIPEALHGTRWFVGTDFSGSALAAVSWAKRAAARVGGELHVANVVIPAGGEDKPDEERTWRQILRDQSKLEAGKKLEAYVDEHAPNAEVHQVVSIDYASEALCNAAKSVAADILVVGTHRQGVLGHLLLGSTASRCLGMASVPVLVVPEQAR
ncbi:MAG: universal stress protein [Polyangiales bacterium]|jgi:nucleotide-binding universal stress UspA family protein